MYVLANLGSPSHWLILVVVCLVIFGAKHLPDIARNLGKGMGEFKKARKQFEDELMKEEKSETASKSIASEAPASSEAKNESSANPTSEKKPADHIDV